MTTYSTLDEMSVGVLWNGEEGNGGVELSVSLDDIAETYSLNALDCRVAMMTSAAEMNASAQKSNQDAFLSKILYGLDRLVELHARLGETHMMASIAVRDVMRESFRMNATGVDITFAIDDEEHGEELLSSVADEISSRYTARGFFVQEITGDIAPKLLQIGEVRLRISWYKPNITGALPYIEDISQIEAYLAGVPISDIVA